MNEVLKSSHKAEQNRKIIATANGASTARRATERKRAAPKAMWMDDKETIPDKRKRFRVITTRKRAETNS